MAEKEMQKREASSPVETERTKNMKVFIPRVDICETKDAIVLLADMPGVDEKSIDITLEKNVLTLSGRVEPDTIKGTVPPTWNTRPATMRGHSPCPTRLTATGSRHR